MVGRELPNLRPHGEDHRGAVGGEEVGMLRPSDPGMVKPGSENWKQMRKIRTIKEGSCCGAARASPVTRSSLQVLIWGIEVVLCDRGWVTEDQGVKMMLPTVMGLTLTKWIWL